MLNPEAQAKREAFDKAIKEAMGIDPVTYTEKRNWLQDKWEKKIEIDRGNSVTTRIMGPIVLEKCGPIYVSIIADNLDYFKKELELMRKNPKKTSYFDILEAFNIACLCGSQQIGEFLLKELNIDYLQKEYEYILGYVCASRNEEWMKVIARAMAQANKKIPSLNLTDTTFTIAEMIEGIFEEVQKGTPENELKRRREEEWSFFLKGCFKKIRVKID